MMQPDQMREAGHALIKAAKERDTWEKAVARQYRVDWDIHERGPIEHKLRKEKVAHKTALGSWSLLEHTLRKKYYLDWGSKPWLSEGRDFSERTEAIRRMLCDEGKTLEQIGEVYGLTRERIRQIADKHDMVWSRQTPIVHAAHVERLRLREEKRSAKRAERDAVVAKARDLVENQGMSIIKAGDAIGWQRGAIHHVAKGWKTRHGRWRPELSDIRCKAVEMYRADPSASIIGLAAQFGVSPPVVSRAIDKAGIAHRFPKKPKRNKPPTPPAVEGIPRLYVRNNTSPIITIDWTDEMVGIVVAMWNAGSSARLIAEQMGLTRSAVLGKLHRLRLSGRMAMRSVAEQLTNSATNHRITP